MISCYISQGGIRMLSLMIKDILLLKKTITFSVLYTIFMIFVFSNLDNAAGVFSFCTVAITHILMMSGCALDEKNKSDVILNSLPLNRSVIVGARYLMVIIYMLFTVAIYILTTWAIGLLNLVPNLYNISLEGFTGAVFASSLLNSIYLPIYFKFGYIKSKIYHFILFFGMFFGINFVATSLVRNTDNPVLQRIEVLFENLSDSMIGIIIAGAAFTLMAISYGISLKIYKKREF